MWSKRESKVEMCKEGRGGKGNEGGVVRMWREEVEEDNGMMVETIR